MALGLGTKRRVAQLLVVASAGGALGTTGCRTTEDDVHRWANTAQGPRKLVAVLKHDKYPVDLRVEAAMTLVRMKPRAGQRVGIEQLIAALSEMAPAPRKTIVSKLVPKLIAELKKPPPAAQGGQPAAPDPSFPYKDAAFAMLTNDGTVLVESDEHRSAIEAALTEWCLADFPPRLDNTSQKFGVEQVLRKLGSSSVVNLPKLIVPDAKKIGTMSKLIADLGDTPTKTEASKRLVAVAKEVDADRWKQKKAPQVEAANKASRLNPTKKQFAAQLEAYQEEELIRVFSSMKAVGGKPVVDYLLAFAKRTEPSEKRRAAAVNALAGHIDKKNKENVDAILAIASADDTPPTVRDLALRRVGELPRELVAPKLYGLFKNDEWKIRWVAAELLLKMSEKKHISEFMTKLGRGSDGMSITEPLRYGALLKSVKGVEKPADIADKYASGAYPAAVRLSALGYYYEHGTKKQLDKVSRYASDRTKVPKCSEDSNDCAWQCGYGEGKKKEVKDIATVGDYVTYCIVPAMKKRTEADLKKKEEKNKKDKDKGKK